MPRSGSTSAARAERICTHLDLAEEAFLAGLMQDIGELVLATSSDGVLRSDPRARAVQKAARQPPDENHLGHAEVGGYVLGLWGFSSLVAEAVTPHHKPLEAKGDARLIAAGVRLAGLLVDGEDGRIDLSEPRVARHVGALVRVLGADEADYERWKQPA